MLSQDKSLLSHFSPIAGGLWHYVICHCYGNIVGEINVLSLPARDIYVAETNFAACEVKHVFNSPRKTRLTRFQCCILKTFPNNGKRTKMADGKEPATSRSQTLRGWGTPSYGYIGMCDPIGYGFSAVLLINRVWILHSNLDMGVYFKKKPLFIIIKKKSTKGTGVAQW